MGYYTSFTLKVDKNFELVDKFFLDSNEGTDWGYIFEDGYKGEWSGYAKWYDYDADMCQLSALFPDVLFTLTGEGEEKGDIWRNWYREGKCIDKWVLVYEIPENPKD